MNQIIIWVLLGLVVLLAVWNLLMVYANRRPGPLQGVKEDLIRISAVVDRIDPQLSREFSQNRDDIQKGGRETREELLNSFKSFSELISKTIGDLAQTQKNMFDVFSGQLKVLTDSQREQLEKIRGTVEQRLQLLQDENAKKLEEMRATVDEKLQKTLEARLSESFKQVSERLEQVHNGLGEMKNLAAGVGDLKKVLSNVKTRGILGEIQLGNILENILAPELFERNFVTKPGSRENVEFAVKLPSKDDDGSSVYLPIDSKFPIEAYNQLLDAYEAGNPEIVRSQAKIIETEIKRCARDIRDKYINPPQTTDFGILFLPVEGLYAEVVRNTSLLETLQRDFKIVITGPTTLAALLNSLQMGFRTLAIQKRSSEVWKILSAIKTEFGRFGEVLAKAQDKINKASEDIDTLVGVRTKKIQSQLKKVAELPETEAKLLLDGDSPNDEPESLFPGQD